MFWEIKKQASAHTSLKSAQQKTFGAIFSVPFRRLLTQKMPQEVAVCFFKNLIFPRLRFLLRLRRTRRRIRGWCNGFTSKSGSRRLHRNGELRFSDIKLFCFSQNDIRANNLQGARKIRARTLLNVCKTLFSHHFTNVAAHVNPAPNAANTIRSPL